MNNVLQPQHHDIDTTANMIYNLHEMFGGQGRQARQQAVRQYMNCRMKAGTPVRDHMMLIISYLNEMEILGSEIDGETKIDMILETLSNSFDTFKLNYSMNKLEYTITEFMKELQTAEGLTKKRRTEREVHSTASTSGSKERPRKAEKKNQPKVQKKKNASKAPKVDKSNDKCHHCNEPGHWRRNCPACLKTKEKGKAKA